MNISIRYSKSSENSIKLFLETSCFSLGIFSLIVNNSRQIVTNTKKLVTSHFLDSEGNSLKRNPNRVGLDDNPVSTYTAKRQRLIYGIPKLVSCCQILKNAFENQLMYVSRIMAFIVKNILQP